MSNYDEMIENISELTDTNIKINPDFYIHLALIKAQQALINPSLNDGLVQYRILVENIEIFAKSAGKLPDDYDEEVEKFKKEKQYKEEKNIVLKGVKLANKKLEYIMTRIFKSKTLKTPMRI